MARGGGTGSRGKGAKKAPTNTESKKTEGLKPTNGPTEDTDGRQKNNKNRNRHKKEGDAPSNNHTEDVNREEKKEVPAKLQPTSEQLRLAQITQMSDAQLDPQHRAKISQVMDITGKTEDEVGTALFDCGWDETKAIEMLIEEGGLGSWEETGKKKKKKEKADNNKENFQEDWDADNDNFDPNQHNNKWEDDSRERSRNRGPPRLRRGGGQSGGDRWAPGGERSQPPKPESWDNNEWSEWKGDGDNAGGGGRGRGGRGMGPRSGRGREDLPPRQRGGGRGAGGDRRQFGNREYGPRGSAAPGDSGGFGAIETWNPVGEERRAPGGARHSNKDAFDNAGNWGDDFPAAEDWDNDEYTGSLSDTKVFTASSGVTQAAVGQPVNGTSPAPAPAAVAPVPVPTPANNSFTNSNYSQPIDLSALLKSPGVTGSSAAPGGPTASLGQFNPQTATQDLKSAIGIGGSSAPGGPPKDYSSASLSYSSGGGSANTYAAPLSTNNSQAFTGSGSAFSPIKPAAVTNGSPTGKALPRARLPPPSKIPSSAVEMPGDSLSNLDVQFGGLDLQFGTGNGESGSSAGTGFEFGGGGGSSGSSLPPPKDIDNKAKYSSIPTSISPDKSLDGYKSVPSVKDVSTSLTSALSAAGINPSSPSDSVPGYVSAPRSDKPATHAVGYGSAPQTIQDQRNKNNVSDNSLGGYNSSSYSYQSTGQPVKPSSQYGQSNSAGYANSNSYERSNSNSYQNSGASLGPAGYPVSTNSYNNSSAGTNSYTAANSPYSVPVQSSTNNYNSGYSSVATTYPSYGGTNSSSYSSKSNNQSSQNSQYAPTTTSNQLSNSQLSSSQLNNSQLSNSQLSNSQLSNSQLSNSQLSNSQLSNSQLSSSYPSATDTTTSTAASLTTPDKYATTTVSAGSYTAVNSTGVAGLLSGTGISSSGGSSTKMSVSSGNGKMGVPNLPPGVASMLPAQYMIGANAAAGFPAYLAAAGLQQPAAMYGYGGVGGVGGHGLEDLAALQRSTLAASLPQLVSGGASGHGGAAPQPGVNKGPSTGGYYDPSSQFATTNSLSSRQDPSSTFAQDSKFGGGGVTDSTSSPVPSTVAPAVQQPQPFNALAAASGFATAAPQQHPTLPPGYAYFYGGMAGPASLQAAYGGVGATGVYPTAHPGLAVPTAAGNTATTQFQNKAYGSSGYTSYDTLGQNNSDYGKSNYGSQGSQAAKSGSNSNSAGHHYWSNALW